ncbi:Mpo1-like protein [Parendozoicomonas sp. Alg238-R29]|uniref:Mpo1 family 2-hydroxy fatty acid dioxygenase n=1 Tax=Parendozoicomonas sp. Alg238-R29 TaxID=2993446 RepID=UPI00248E0EA7|nr:Mpo1-like protein [Parendozoicomonas sp. Alg238-R29]
MSGKTADQWFEEYGESHQNKLNKMIHWVCVPLIFLDIMALLWSIPAPAAFAEIHPYLNWATLSSLFILGFYIRLSFTLTVGMVVLTLLSYTLIVGFESMGIAPLWLTAAIAFVVLWTLQFIGHHVEGKKPSFLADLQYLMIGPAWCLGFVYRKVGIRY